VNSSVEPTTLNPQGMKTLATTLIAPRDLLDGARTIPRGQISTCDWLSEWTSATVFLQWAERSFTEGDAYGLSNAVSSGGLAGLDRKSAFVKC
jgi:hypothetical protein